MAYKMRAVCPRRGVKRPTLGPGLSARIRFMVPAFLSIFTMASVNTRMPMPPSQCVKLRQYSMPRPSTSTSERMDAPVVVKPLTVSNRASTK